MDRAQILAELDRRGKLPAQFRAELAQARLDNPSLDVPPAGVRGYMNPTLAGQRASAVDLARGQPNTTGGQIQAMERMLLHGRDVLRESQALDNFSSGPGALFNSPLNWKRQLEQDSRLNGFTDAVDNYAPEAQKAISGGLGGEAERQSRAKHFAPNMSPQSIAAALQSDAKQAYAAATAANDRYKRINGHDIPNPLSADARAAYDEIMAGGFGHDGKPLSPAKDAPAFALGAPHPSSLPPPGGSQPAGGSPPPPSTPAGAGGSPPGGSGGGDPTTTDFRSLAQGSWRTEHDVKAERLIKQLVQSGQNADQINAALQAIGVDARRSVDQAAVTNAQTELKKGHQVAYESLRAVPISTWQQLASSKFGVGALGAVDGASGGLTDEAAGAIDALRTGKPFYQAVAEANAAKQGAFAAHPGAAFIGETAGSIGSMAGLGALGRATGLASRFANPQLVGDLAFGAASGAGQVNDHRLLGALIGTAGGAAGNVLSAGVGAGIGALTRTAPGRAATNSVRGMFGRGLISEVAPLAPADVTLLGAVNRAGVGNVTGALDEASRLGIPMSLADTSPTLRELGGAVVRRSPEASSIAENAFLPRAQGQYDRFTGAVQRNLGPTTNIPQQSIDLTQQARTAAGPLYDKAYANAVPSSPELENLLATPFGKQALSRAHVIAANEGRNPSELGFALDADGNTALNARPNDLMARHLDASAAVDDAQEAYKTARRTPGADVDEASEALLAARDKQRQAAAALRAAPDPNTAASVPTYTQQTLDYVKRGMDDVLDEQRDKTTGRLNLDEAGRAQNGVRSRFVNEMDRLNPDYAAARQAYAGPVQARDAMARGKDAYGLHPDELGIQVGLQTPEQLAQMQLGYRGAMLDHAGKVRDASNPWDATLASPASRQRLSTMYPGVDGVDAMLRQQALERQLAQNTTAILGNSKTAQRGIADQAFANSPLMEGALHAGTAMATGGHSLPLTAARFGLNYLKDGREFGLGQQAVAKADALAPSLFNTDPDAALARVNELLAQQQAWNGFKDATTPRWGMFGRGVGSQAAIAPVSR